MQLAMCTHVRVIVYVCVHVFMCVNVYTCVSVLVFSVSVCVVYVCQYNVYSNVPPILFP